MSILAFRSAIEIAHSIRSREIGAVECLDYFRNRVERYNPQLNAIVLFDWERAGKRAADADRALARGEVWGPLHGVPMTVKESFDLAGHPTTWGDPAFKHYRAPKDDLAVERLTAAGAVVFGKTNVPLHLRDFQTYNEIYGSTNNPWDLTRVPGGSSGGAAAALAAGLTGLELGSDIGGSIRNPAHYCGVFGHKSTYRLVGTDGLSPPTYIGDSDLAVAGPLARSAEDLALAMTFLAGPGPFETPVWQPTLPKPVKQLKDYRIAVWPDDALAPVDAEIAGRCQGIAERLVKLGAKVSDRARPSFDARHSREVYRQLLPAVTDPTNTMSHREWQMLNQERAQLRLAWRDFFNDWDIVLCPIAATPAFAHDHSPLRGRILKVNGADQPYFQQIFWAGLVTVSYLPSTVFPTGPGSAGLPIGLQAVGKAYDDLITIDFARLLSKETGGFVAPAGYGD